MLKQIQGHICKVFIGPTVTIVDNDKDEYFEVETYIETDKLKKGTGYIIGDYVYIYQGRYNENKPLIPGSIYKKSLEYILVDHTDRTKEIYHISKVNNLNTQNILSLLESDRENFIQMEDVEIINNNAEVFVPMIKEDDDFLKYIVKKMIINKKINLRNYKDKFPNEYALNNMKSGLSKSTKMTVTNFSKWCEVLGCSWKIEVKDDNTDPINPMNEVITVESGDF